ncbi:hypothetical protein C7212DRAFT_306747, partial [Tuber magnatum]
MRVGKEKWKTGGRGEREDGGTEGRLKENKLEGERWEVESERRGKIGWKVNISSGKKEGIRRWEEEREERERNWIVG